MELITLTMAHIYLSVQEATGEPLCTINGPSDGMLPLLLLHLCYICWTCQNLCQEIVWSADKILEKNTTEIMSIIIDKM